MTDAQRKKMNRAEWEQGVKVGVSQLFDSILNLASGAHRIDHTAAGQDLRPMLNASIYLVRAIFPDDAEVFKLTADIEAMVKGETYAKTPAQRKNAQ